MNQSLELVDKMNFIIFRLKSLCYLVENQNPQADKPVDLDEINYGFAMILSDIVIELEAIKNDLEKF